MGEIKDHIGRERGVAATTGRIGRAWWVLHLGEKEEEGCIGKVMPGLGFDV